MAASFLIEPLGEPEPIPESLGGAEAGWADELREDLAGPEDWVGWATDRLVPAAQAIVRLASIPAALAFRVPLDRAWAVWDTQPEEVRPIVAALLPIVPRTPFARFALGKLPGLAAGVQGAGLAIDRVRATRELRVQEDTDGQHARPAPDPRPRPGGAPAYVAPGYVAPQPRGDDSGRGGAPGVGPDQRSLDVDRPSGPVPDGTVIGPTLLAHLVGGHGPER